MKKESRVEEKANKEQFREKKGGEEKMRERERPCTYERKKSSCSWEFQSNPDHLPANWNENPIAVYFPSSLSSKT